MLSGIGQFVFFIGGLIAIVGGLIVGIKSVRGLLKLFLCVRESSKTHEKIPWMQVASICGLQFLVLASCSGFIIFGVVVVTVKVWNFVVAILNPLLS